ncbi:MAG: Hpt domain-containing protein [Pseudomonadota bacterium]
MDRIKELEQEIGAEDLGAVLSIFLSEAEKTIASIGQGLDDGDHARATHFLRSGALNMGLVGFADAADQAASVDAPLRSETAADLETALASSVAELENIMSALC